MYSLVSLNIRPASKDRCPFSPTYWKRRIKSAELLLDVEGPDFLCLQDAEPRQAARLAVHYGYSCIGKVSERGLCNPIIYKYRKQKLVDYKFFDLPGDTERTAAWVLFEDMANRTRTIIINARTDEDDALRARQRERLVVIANTFRKGDEKMFLCESAGERCSTDDKVFSDSGLFRRRYVTTGTFHGFDGGIPPVARRTDNIYYGNGISVVNSRVILEEGRYMSDHYAIELTYLNSL